MMELNECKEIAEVRIFFSFGERKGVTRERVYIREGNRSFVHVYTTRGQGITLPRASTSLYTIFFNSFSPLPSFIHTFYIIYILIYIYMHMYMYIKTQSVIWRILNSVSFIVLFYFLFNILLINSVDVLMIH